MSLDNTGYHNPRSRRREEADRSETQGLRLLTSAATRCRKGFASTSPVTSLTLGLGLVCLLGVMLLAGCTSKEQKQVQALAFREQGDAKDQAGQPALALELYMKAKKLTPEDPEIYLRIANIASALNQPQMGLDAIEKMVKLAPQVASNKDVMKLKAVFDNKLHPKPPPAGSKDKPFVNSLGMKFVSVPGTRLLASIWETRVQDFAAFVEATGYDTTEGMYSIGEDGWKQRGHTWKNPGFEQTVNHAVCGVSWTDAVKFCDWLTSTERESGAIGPNDQYRLPTDVEWSTLVGSSKYPWGNQWPPPSGAGNYAGTEAGLTSSLENYQDGYARTAPVGSFNPTSLGIYDLGGNVWEWCSDWYRKEMNTDEARKEVPALNDYGGGQEARVVRGASWNNDTRVNLSSAYRNRNNPGNRNDNNGFRCVLVVGGGGRKAKAKGTA